MVKTNRANGQTGGKHPSSTSVLTAFVSFGLFNIFLNNLHLMTVLTMILVA
jgi:hypothetical protein